MQVILGETKCARENEAFHTVRSVDDWSQTKNGLSVLIAIATLLFIVAIV